MGRRFEPGRAHVTHLLGVLAHLACEGLGEVTNINGWAALLACQVQESWFRLIRGSPSGKMLDPTHIWGGSVLEREGCALSEYFPT